MICAFAVEPPLQFLVVALSPTYSYYILYLASLNLCAMSDTDPTINNMVGTILHDCIIPSFLCPFSYTTPPF